MKRAVMLWFLVLAIIGLFSGLFSAAGAQAQDSKVDKQELERLQGTWVLVSGEVKGNRVTAEAVKAGRMTYSGVTVTLKTPHQSKKPITGRVTRLDPTKTVREMDWVRSAGPGAGRTIQAVYEFDGEDAYKVCFDPAGRDRPTVFSTTTGGCENMHVWKRVKK